DYKMAESDFNKDVLKGFEITIKKQNYEKDFYFDLAIYDGDSYDIPVKTGVYNYYISVFLEGSDHYTENEFYNFLDNLSISFRTEFINKLI
ncbi:XRE family transcriptional regulator, partial [Staphylococcus haemolyticus]